MRMTIRSRYLPVLGAFVMACLVLDANVSTAQTEETDQPTDRVEQRRAARERLQQRLERRRDASPEQRKRLREELEARWHSADRLQRDDLHDRTHALREQRRDQRSARMEISPDALRRQRDRLEGREAQRELARVRPKVERRALGRSLLQMTPAERSAVRARIAEGPDRERQALGDEIRAFGERGAERWRAMSTAERDDLRRRMHRLHALSPAPSALGEE